MDPLEKWDDAVKAAKNNNTSFQILRGPLLKKAQRIYCASTNFFLSR